MKNSDFGKSFNNEVIKYQYITKRQKASLILIPIILIISLILYWFNLESFALIMAIISFNETFDYCFDAYQKKQCKKRMKELLQNECSEDTNIVDIKIEVS
jgi:hypothetical protein